MWERERKEMRAKVRKDQSYSTERRKKIHEGR